MRERLKSKKGFTLAELLIVVAIIAILIAIMVPVFGTSREKAILEKDASNVRSAYSEAVMEAMASGTYDASGVLQVTLPKVDGLQCDVIITDESIMVVSRVNATNYEEIEVDSDVYITLNAADGNWIAQDLRS